MTDQPDVLGSYSLEVVRDLLGQWAATNRKAQQVQAAIPPDLLADLLVKGDAWDVLVLPLASVPTDELQFGLAVLDGAVRTLDRVIDERSLSHPPVYGQGQEQGTTRDVVEAGMDDVDGVWMAALEEEVERLRTELSRTRALLVAHLEVCPGASRALNA